MDLVLGTGELPDVTRKLVMSEVHSVLGTGTFDASRPAPPFQTVHFKPEPVDVFVDSGLASLVYALPEHARGDIIPTKLHVVAVRPEDTLPPDAASILQLRTAYGLTPIQEVGPFEGTDIDTVPATLHRVGVNVLGLFRGRETTLTGIKYAAVVTYEVPDVPPTDPPADPPQDPPADPTPVPA